MKEQRKAPPAPKAAASQGPSQSAAASTSNSDAQAALPAEAADRSFLLDDHTQESEGQATASEGFGGQGNLAGPGDSAAEGGSVPSPVTPPAVDTPAPTSPSPATPEAAEQSPALQTRRRLPGPQVSVLNDNAAPSGGDARRTVGIGEKSRFTVGNYVAPFEAAVDPAAPAPAPAAPGAAPAPAPATPAPAAQGPVATAPTCEAESGTLTQVDASTWDWTAPLQARSYVLTFRMNGREQRITMHVVAPSNVMSPGKKKADQTWTQAAFQGVLIYPRIRMMPNTVSFYHLKYQEVSGPGTGTGIWGRPGVPTSHTATTPASPLDDKNETWDTVGWSGMSADLQNPVGWSTGRWTVDIPQQWVAPDGTTGGMPHVQQEVRIVSRDGTSTAEKLGQRGRRTP